MKLAHFIALCAVLALVFAGIAAAAGPPKDPRLCAPSHTDQIGCARAAAVLALRFAAATHWKLPFKTYQGPRPQCIATTRDWLNFRCTIWHDGVLRHTTVSLGRAPLWKPTVRFLD